MEQNLLRLSDIVEEVGNRLRNVRAQAAKAQRYREYSERLQQLRTSIALTEWRALSARLAATEADLRKLQDQIDGAAAQLTADEARMLEVETEIMTVAEYLRDCEHREARAREQIMMRESTMEHGRQLLGEADTESTRCRMQIVALTGRADDVARRLDETAQKRAALEAADADILAQMTAEDAEVNQRSTQLDAQRRDLEQCRIEYVETVKKASQCAAEIALHESQRGTAESTLARCAARLAHLEREHQQIDDQLEQTRQGGASLGGELESVTRQLEVAQRELAENERLLSRRRDELAVQRGRLGGVSERAALLDELERRHEGLTAGVQQVVTRARREPDGPFASVIGLVADVLEVPMQWAPLVDAALGPVAQHVVLRDATALDALQEGRIRLAGRVGFLVLSELSIDMPSVVDLTAHPGVLGRLDAFVSVAPEAQRLPQQLLSGTWAVEMLEHARALRAAGIHDVCLVTLAGEVVQSNGAIVAGPKDVGGLISHRTELRDLRREEKVLQAHIDEGEQETSRLRENIEQQRVAVRLLNDRHRRCNEEWSNLQVEVRTLEGQLAQVTEEVSRVRLDQAAASVQLAELVGRGDEAVAMRQQLETRQTALETAIQQNEQQLRGDERALRECQRRATATRVERAKSEQRLEGMRLQIRQFEIDQQERSRALAEAQQQLTSAEGRCQASLQLILSATTEVAALYLQKDALTCEIRERQHSHRQNSAQRATLSEQVKRQQRDLAQMREKLHGRELAAGEVRHERLTLSERIRDDYGLEIDQLVADSNTDPVDQREAVDQEIAGLRRKLSNIGAVNMEALEELDDLESRHGSLHGQFQDLTQAKEALERIIHKINADSRRLFSETLEAIRTNFQQLYRRAFGGGKADLVLEEGVDILECGVDILATPPGKPSFSNSLLSGGEKALTAVALLLAIFQYRPSPFCVLDEVDAPFDEANIGRFVEVLKDFLGWTRFVLVTHSKKTMTAATTLYGVTMQESGVSKQVSVRFEDVSEDGQISSEAVRRAENRTSPNDDQAA